MSFVPGLPDGHLPDGHLPESDGSGPDPLPAGFEFALEGSAIPLLDPDDVKTFTPNWEGILPEGVTLTSVEHAVPLPLVRVGQETTSGIKSSVRISTGRHAGMFIVEMLAQLSSGATMSKSFPLRCFNG